MTRSPRAELRPETDDYTFSSFIRRQIHPPDRARSGAKSWRSLLVLFALPVLAACQAETAPAPKPEAKFERPVQVQRVTYGTNSSVREFVGVVRARYETDLAFRVGGKIVARAVNVGDRVSTGDDIARLDPQDLQLQVESAEAELAAATSNLFQAAADLRRYDRLRERGFAAIAEYDRKKAANDEAESRLARARRALDLARNQHSYAELKANVDGVITAALAEPGQVVAVGQAVARLAHRGEKEALVALPETWLGDVRAAKATVRLWADRDRSYTAKLRELSPQADPATRTYAARFSILDADDSVAYGMTATVTLERAGEGPVARLPLAAVLNRGTGPAVYVVSEGSALALRKVTVSSFTEATALITSGLQDGDNVVTLGVHKLEAGLKVRTVEARQ